MSKQNKVIFIVLILAAAAALVYLSRNPKVPADNGRIDIAQTNTKEVRPIDAADHLIGRLNAPVQMIVYSDFQCPFCAQFALTMKQVEANFPDKVAISFRHYPLPSHAQAVPAAIASECAAEQGKFWQMHDKLFADNTANRMSVAQFKQDAAELGLDTAKFNQCLDQNKYQDKINQEKTEGERMGVSGTPASFINGKVYPGAYPFADFTASDGRQEKGMESIVLEELESKK